MMANTHRQHRRTLKSQSPLARAEWDFAPCRNEEVGACHAYEFARQVEVLKETVRLFQAARPGAVFDDLWAEAMNPRNALLTLENGHGLPLGSYSAFPEFPATPYLGIPVRERLRRLSQSNVVRVGGIYETDIEHIVSDGPGYTFHYSGVPGEGWFERGTNETVAFDIDWSSEDELIIRQFAHWLREKGPDRRARIKVRTERGKGSLTAQLKVDLKALGAWRLLQRMHWQDALTYSEEVTGRRLFGDQPAWIRAGKRAGKVINNLSANKSD